MILIYDINMGYNHSNHGLRKILYDIFSYRFVMGKYVTNYNSCFLGDFQNGYQKGNALAT